VRAIDLILFTVLLISATIAMIRFKSLPTKERIIAILLILTFPQVVICFILFKQKQGNLYLIYWYSLIEFILLMTYYHLLLTKVLFRKISVTLAVIGVLWFAVPFFFQKPLLYTFSFLLFEALAIIIVGLLYCLDLFLKEETSVMQRPSFWIAILLLVYWTTTYTRNGLFVFNNRVSAYFLSLLDDFFLVTGILFYASLAGILFAYKKFLKANE
jgi:hypothetical protein